jgi:1-phosphatidylinositol-3-phosphate 5-kinase
MAVARIEAHHPNILLVEKTVSRFAQDRLLAREISVVLNVKRPLLERIAQCTGAQVVPSPDNLSAPKTGQCELFHIEKFVEEHDCAIGQGGRQSPYLMFFEGCPRPLGCTVCEKIHFQVLHLRPSCDVRPSFRVA